MTFWTLDLLQWLPYQSDFSPILWPWYRAWPSPNYEWFSWSICNGCGMPAGNACPSGHLVPSLLWLSCAPIVETSFHKLFLSFLDFSPWIALGTFVDFASKNQNTYFSHKRSVFFPVHTDIHSNTLFRSWAPSCSLISEWNIFHKRPCLSCCHPCRQICLEHPHIGIQVDNLWGKGGATVSSALPFI